MESTAINTNVNVEIQPGTINSNLSILSTSVDEKLFELKNMTYSGSRDERLKMMKKDRIDCNKAIEALDEVRKSQKKAYMGPWTSFENEIKNISGKIKETATELDSQVKALEAERRAESRTKIRAYFDTISEPLGDFADEFYCKVYQDSWENVTTSQKTYKDALSKAVADFISGMKTLTIMKSDTEIREKAIERFHSTLNQDEAIQFMVEENDKLDKLRIRIEEEERKKAEAAKEQEIQAAMKKAADEARLEAAKDISSFEIPVGFQPIPEPVFDQTSSVTIEFDQEEWELVKKYCDKMQIFYYEK